LNPLHGLTPQLQDDVEGAAILVVLMSPHYLASDWCRREREWWSARQVALGLPADGRVAVIRIWPTKDAWPRELKDSRGADLPGFWFFDRKKAAFQPQPYEYPKPGPDSKGAFREELMRLTDFLKLSLDSLQAELANRRRLREKEQQLGDPGRVVYLHGREEHASGWEQAFDALIASGFSVVPDAPQPVVADVKQEQLLRKKRVEIMSDCDALLLAGSEDSGAVIADMVVVGRQDRNSARARSNRLLPCALLDRLALPAATTSRRKAIARSLNVEWIDATMQPWTPAVQNWLAAVGHAGGVG
jgi:hypothetical protein